MKPKKLPENVAAKVQAWLGNHSVLHFWECDGTFLINAKRHDQTGDLYCLRVFPIGESLELSQDNIIFGEQV